MIRETNVKTLPRTVSVAEGEGEERRIEEHRRKDKGNQHQKSSRKLQSWRGDETKGENQHEREMWHNPQSREGGGGA